MTYKHDMKQPMPLFERRINRILYKNKELIETLDNIDLTSHMGAYENRSEDVYVSSDENEKIVTVLLVFLQCKWKQ